MRDIPRNQFLPDLSMHGSERCDGLGKPMKIQFAIMQMTLMMRPLVVSGYREGTR